METTKNTRQLSRLFNEAADAAGIKKSVTLHHAGSGRSIATEYAMKVSAYDGDPPL
jgi:hypothetical protein